MAWAPNIRWGGGVFPAALRIALWLRGTWGSAIGAASAGPGGRPSIRFLATTAILQ